MLKRLALLCLVSAAVLCGCKGTKTGEVSVPEVQDIGQTGTEEVGAEVEAGEAEVQEPDPIVVGKEPGSVLGEEEIVLMQEGETVTVPYNRIQGINDFTIAYDPESFTLEAGDRELCFYSYSYGADSETPVFVKITESEEESAEALADQYVADSNEECMVEEVTIGEGEYPATWISYSEGTDAKSRTCDIYIFRYNEKLYVVQMDCFVEAYESLGAIQESILSTLRFDEG